MTWEVSTSACSDLHALVREWCRAHQQAGNLEQAERFAIQVGQLAAECAFECAVEACGTKAGYCGASLPGQRIAQRRDHRRFFAVPLRATSALRRLSASLGSGATG